MGALKQLELEDQGLRDAAWQFVAEKNGFRCKVCGEFPLREERDIYFDTKMCGYHAYQQKTAVPKLCPQFLNRRN